jgi:predicted transcriptional regulator
MRRHSRLEIYLDLLHAVSRSSDLVDIAKKTGLSLSTATKHLTFLASQGFVSTLIADDGIIKYELTPKGFEALMAFLRLTAQEQPILQH